MVNIDIILRTKLFSGTNGSKTANIGQNFVSLSVIAMPLRMAVWVFGRRYAMDIFNIKAL
jgi:hypothetical protein